MTEKSLVCPYVAKGLCGGGAESVEVQKAFGSPQWSDEYWFLECQSCCATGPNCPTESEARRAWEEKQFTESVILAALAWDESPGNRNLCVALSEACATYRSHIKDPPDTSTATGRPGGVG